ncbi:MAG: inositol monophosphatase family protein [Rickettsiales bacterium]
MELPATLLEDMKAAALLAGQHALKVQQSDAKETKLKDDHSLVTIADGECEQIIRDRLQTYTRAHGFTFQGEETGLSQGTSDFAFIVDPIDGTTNYEIGDPNWMVSIAVTYKGTPVAGVTYQPELDKLYFAQEGQGSFLTRGGNTKRLHISDATAKAHVFETLFSRHPDRGAQRALHAIIDEWIPALTGNKQHARYRTTGCPSVPLCMLAEDARSGLVAKPIKLHDVAASMIIASEAGAQISLEPENSNDTSPDATYGLVAASTSLFPTLKKIYDDTIGHVAHFYQPMAGEDAAAQLAANDIKYGICIGRRQPMHIMHLDCIQEIVESGLKPVIVIGSANTADDSIFDPLDNPLTEAQQREQLRIAMAAAGISDYKLLALKDVGSPEFWVGSLSKLLHDNGISSRQSVSHFRTKSTDRDKGGIVPLKDTQEMSLHYGISLWQSHNRHASQDEFSATPFRSMALDAPENQKALRETLVAPGYIRGIASAARADNPDMALLKDVPVTMLDLTLQRLRLERHLSTAELLGHKPVASVEVLKAAIIDALGKPGTDITGQLTAVTAQHEQGAANGK